MCKRLPIRCSSESLSRLVIYAINHGWSVTRTNGNHVKFSKRGCTPVFTGYSASDARASKNCIAQLKRNERAGDMRA